MNINELYQLTIGGGKPEEEKLFKKLRVSLLYLVEQRIWNDQDAEEIVHEILITVAEKYRLVVIEKSFAAWIYGIMENKLLHYYRSKGRQKELLSEADTKWENESDNTLNPYLIAKLLDCLKKVNKANDRYARILNLRYLGYSTEEICGKMKITRNNAFVILTRARSMLKHCLNNGGTK